MKKMIYTAHYDRAHDSDYLGTPSFKIKDAYRAIESDHAHLTRSERAEIRYTVEGYMIDVAEGQSAKEAFKAFEERELESNGWLPDPDYSDDAINELLTIEAYSNEIADAMRDAHRDVIESDGREEVSVYVWSDGEIETLHEAQGSNSFLRARSGESRSLYYVATIDAPCFDWIDYTDESIPDEEEDPLAYAAVRDEVIDWLIDEYDPAPVIDARIEELRYML